MLILYNVIILLLSKRMVNSVWLTLIKRYIMVPKLLQMRLFKSDLKCEISDNSFSILKTSLLQYLITFAISKDKEQCHLFSQYKQLLLSL